MGKSEVMTKRKQGLPKKKDMGIGMVEINLDNEEEGVSPMELGFEDVSNWKPLDK